jgi:IS605 OrfB family transposase
MSKYFIPLNLKQFQVTTPNITTKQVEEQLRLLMGWLKAEQNTFYETNFDTLSEKIINAEQPLTGSLNSLGRKLGVNPTNPAEHHTYNMAEMFRASVLSKMGGHLQNNILVNLITTMPSPTSVKVIAAYKKDYPFAPTPTSEFVKRTILRLEKGVLHGVPSGDGVLLFWATDTHYSKLVSDTKMIHFTVRLPVLGSVTLSFKIPNGARFQGDKVTRPNVFLTKHNQLVFGFTVQQRSLPKLTTSNVFGVDLGRVVPFVGTVVDPVNSSYTPAFLPNKQVNNISTKIKTLTSLTNQLWVKETMNKIKGYERKAEILRVERLRVRGKISRLKNERTHRMATQIVMIATQYNAVITLENLDWVENSKWEQSLQQQTITTKAERSGVRVKKINPAHTSNTCPTCLTPTTHTNRSTYCPKCTKKLDRDVLASRNIGLRGTPRVITSLYGFTQSLRTRVTRSVTPGSTISHVPSYYSPVTRNTT